MDERMIRKLACRRLRSRYNKVGWALLVYYGIMNIAVTAVMLVLSIIVPLFVADDPGDLNNLQMINDIVMQYSTWGYVLAVIIGAGALLLWKKPKFCFRTIWKTEKSMSFGQFLSLLVIFISGQAVYQVLAPILMILFDLMGISLLDSIESASASTDTFGMFLYVCVLAPVWEEILFRGFVMRTMEANGKKFAILTSALLFGIFHGNVVQTPYAFVVGLVLGYVAMEYNIVWAMVLHMVNNMLLGDTLGRLLQWMPPLGQDLTFLALIWSCVVAAVIVMICKRRQIRAYFRSGKIHPLCLRGFVTSPGILVLTVILLGTMLISLFL